MVSNILQDQNNPNAIQAFNELFAERGLKNIKAQEIIRLSKMNEKEDISELERFARGADAVLF